MTERPEQPKAKENNILGRTAKILGRTIIGIILLPIILLAIALVGIVGILLIGLIVAIAGILTCVLAIGVLLTTLIIMIALLLMLMQWIITGEMPTLDEQSSF